MILDMKKHGIEVFDEFGRYNYVNTQTILPTHTHSDMIEICYLAKGSQEYFVGNNTFRLYGGDIFIAFPNEIHGTGEVPEEKGVLYWMDPPLGVGWDMMLAMRMPRALSGHDRRGPAPRPAEVEVRGKRFYLTFSMAASLS